MADITANAMTRATTCGMVLRRITLRIIMGRIMLLQGDRSGIWLVQRAIRDADQIGYQAAVQYGQGILLSSVPAHVV